MADEEIVHEVEINAEVENELDFSTNQKKKHCYDVKFKLEAIELVAKTQGEKLRLLEVLRQMLRYKKRRWH